VKNSIHIGMNGWDDDLIDVVFSCSNGRISAQVHAYLPHDALPTMATTLSGFASRATDRRDLALGALQLNLGSGGIQLHFHCLDSAGHPVCDVKLRNNQGKAFGEMESAAFRIPVEAASVDSFVGQLRNLKKLPGSEVFLPMAI